MKCLVCQNYLIEFLNLGKLPPSDYFAASKFAAKNTPLYKLSVGRCKKCHLIQNLYIVSANTRYKKLKYTYNSANSNYAKEHWSNYVNEISKIFKKDLKFLDVGCNDGYLLNLIQKKTSSNYISGIDASPFQILQSKKKYKKINFFCNYAEKSSKLFKKNYFDIITFNNVFNHSSNPILFLKEINKILNANGTIIIEVPNWIATVKNKLWDQVYHEHTMYFTPYTISEILRKCGFEIIKIKNIDYHGGSLRVFAKKKSIIYKKKIYKDLSLKESKQIAIFAQTMKERTLKKINSIKNKPIYLFGAPAKGNTLINYFGLTNRIITACLETSKNKIGKYMPKSCIPIISEKKIINNKKGGYIINLSWNIPFIFDKFCKKIDLKKILV
jgi:2-polyprenyl-3-methyl-5-hydroxy-6-metoxy-1,4-benzoquinol methylase